MKKAIWTAFVLTLLLTGCGQFADGGGSVWQGGLWIIPTVTGLGAAWFWYVTIRAHFSGSNKINAAGFVTNEEGGRMPLYQIGQFWYAVGLTIATIVIIIMVNADK